MNGLFDKNMTNVCKGVAILLLLCNHLIPFHGTNNICLRALASYGNICVSIFLFLSGYGLMRSKQCAPWFRLFRLYLNFWIVAFLFIAISLGVFGRDIYSVYAQEGWLGLIKDLLAISVRPKFNPTWWYMRTAVICYVLYPLFYEFVRRSHYVFVLGIAVFFTIFGIAPGKYLITFVLGMVIAESRLFDSGFSSKMLFRGAIMLFFIVLSALRRVVGDVFDSLLAFSFVLLLADIFRHMEMRLIGKSIGFIGLHSMNIFLLHTFIFYYFFPNFFMKISLWVGILLLLFLSLMCSIIVEWVKKICGVKFLISHLGELAQHGGSQRL